MTVSRNLALKRTDPAFVDTPSCKDLGMTFHGACMNLTDISKGEFCEHFHLNQKAVHALML